MAERKFNFEEICVSFSARNRFYVVLLSKINKINDPSIGTCGVSFSDKGKIVLRYNPDFFKKFDLSQAHAILEHELLHLVFRHIQRIPAKENDAEYNKVRNIAMDIAINPLIRDFPKEGLKPSQYNLPDGMIAEWYLDKLLEQQDQKQEGGKGQSKNQEKNQDNESGDDQGESSRGTHEFWTKTIDSDGNQGDVKGNEHCDVEHEIETIIKQAIKESQNHKSFGDLPSEIRKELKDIANPVKNHDWSKEFKRFVQTILAPNKITSQKRVNRRFIELVDYVIAGKKKDRRSKILVGRDTSSSVYNEDVQKKFFNELCEIAKNCEVIVADCDTEVKDYYTVKKVEDFKTCKGGGGTAFEPVFELAKKLNVDGVIYLTDTYGSFPKKEEIGKFGRDKTLWVTVDHNDKVTLPFGKHLDIRTNKKGY